MNKTMLDMYGDSYEEAREVNINDLSSQEPPYTQEGAMSFIEMAINEGPQVFEWHARQKNGELFSLG